MSNQPSRNLDVQPTIIMGADGLRYRQVELEDGSYDFEPLLNQGQDEEPRRKVPTRPGVDLGTEMVDEEVYQAQRDMRSSDKYFGWDKNNPHADKNKLRRQEHLKRQLEQTLLDRVDPGPGGQRIIKDNEYQSLHEMYRQAQAAGEANRCEFQPLSAYAHKITKARPVLQGEVGMLGSVILVLEQGYGTGNLVAVPGGSND